MGIDYNLSQSIFNVNIGLIYIYWHIEFRIQGNLMVTYQEIQNMFSPAITFKFNTVLTILLPNIWGNNNIVFFIKTASVT